MKTNSSACWFGGINMNKETNRVCLGSFDFIKGVAISVVVLGHIALNFDITRLTWFYPLFAVLELLKTPFMPLFFIISGYFGYTDDRERLKAKSVAFIKRTLHYMLFGFGFYIVFDFIGCYIEGHGVGYYFTTLFY
jgi:fucose 4-O-acetylase-like acetyltransferase